MQSNFYMNRKFFFTFFQFTPIYMRSLLLLFFISVSLVSKSQLPSFQWVKGLGGTNAEEGAAITTDGSGNVLSSGWFKGTADLDPGAGSYTVASFGDQDIYVSKLDPQGNFIWGCQLG